jgi:hypothetical protein
MIGVSEMLIIIYVIHAYTLHTQHTQFVIFWYNVSFFFSDPQGNGTGEKS